MPKQKRARKAVTVKQFGLRANDIISNMIEEIMVAEGHNSWAGAITQAIRDKHERLVEVGRIVRAGDK